MAQADIKITLHSDGQLDGWPHFCPGDQIQGSVTVIPDENVRCKRLFAHLGWHTEGRGTTYRATVSEQDLYEGEFVGGLPRSYNFSFVLPPEPWSYQGYYISIVWEVKVQIDVPWARDPVARANFILRP